MHRASLIYSSTHKPRRQNMYIFPHPGAHTKSTTRTCTSTAPRHVRALIAHRYTKTHLYWCPRPENRSPAMAAYRRINLWAGLLEATAVDTVAVQTRWEERSGSLLNVMLYGKPGSLGAPAPPRRWPLTRMNEEMEEEAEEEELHGVMASTVCSVVPKRERRRGRRRGRPVLARRTTSHTARSTQHTSHFIPHTPRVVPLSSLLFNVRSPQRAASLIWRPGMESKACGERRRVGQGGGGCS